MRPPSTWNVRAIIVVIALALVLPGCDASGPWGTGPPATNVAPASLLPTTVSALPSFDFDSFERLLYELRGTPVIVNIWASWCGPCRTETPILVHAAERYGTHVQFLGVDIQDGRDTASSFLSEHAVPYPSVFDVSGDIHDRLGFVGLPDTLFYSADGAIVATWTGPLTAQALKDGIGQVLDGGEAAPST
jgi:cytochrome c biogenesis protein CcmG, thiol:disulfide interchange protein DsbE